MLARALPDIPIIVDKDRYEAGAWAASELGSDVLVLDDGYQHLALARDLNILLIDATDTFGGFEMAPFGRLRRAALWHQASGRCDRHSRRSRFRSGANRSHHQASLRRQSAGDVLLFTDHRTTASGNRRIIRRQRIHWMESGRRVWNRKPRGVRRRLVTGWNQHREREFFP